jgi:lysophospholipase L1-like esterase
MRIAHVSRRSVLAALLAVALVGCGGGGGGAVRTIAYVGIGASDAVGIGALPLSEGYVPQLAEAMRGTGVEVTLLNLGINGAHVDDMVASELTAAVDASPDIVTVWTGANDLIGGDDPDAFAAQLDTLLRTLKTSTTAEVFVGDLPDLTQAPRFRNNPDPDVTLARVAAFNQRIADTVAATGCVLVLLSAIPFDDSMFWIDGFHPSNAGHDELTTAFFAEIAPRL